MAKKNTAHRPSQSHLEYVTTKDGRKVKNTAYVAPSKKKSDPYTFEIKPIAVQTVIGGKVRTNKYPELNENRRIDMIQNGEDVEAFVNDPAWYVRNEVAKKGYGLNILIDDEIADVRETVAEQGYGHDVLKNDTNDLVRLAVVDTTHNKDILSEMTGDPNKEIAKTAKARLRKLSE